MILSGYIFTIFKRSKIPFSCNLHSILPGLCCLSLELLTDDRNSKTTWRTLLLLHHQWSSISINPQTWFFYRKNLHKNIRITNESPHNKKSHSFLELSNTHTHKWCLEFEVEDKVSKYIT